VGPLYTPLTRTKKYLPPGCNVTIRLYLNRPEIAMLESDEKPLCKIQIKKAEIHVDHIELSPLMKLSLEKQVLEQPFIFCLPNKQIAVRFIGKDSMSATLENLGSIYDRVHIAFVRATALSGHRQQDPFKFENIGLRQVVLTRGSDRFSYSHLDVSHKKFGDTFVELQRSLGGPDAPFSPEAFAKDAFILSFALSPNNPNMSLPSKVETTTRLEMEFIAKLEEQYAVIILINRPKIMEIDHKRKVSIK
jgi:hypothetical protein